MVDIVDTGNQMDNVRSDILSVKAGHFHERLSQPFSFNLNPFYTKKRNQGCMICYLYAFVSTNDTYQRREREREICRERERLIDIHVIKREIEI
jgi:hypothetical protein